MAALLLDKGADREARDTELGATPLYQAAAWGRTAGGRTAAGARRRRECREQGRGHAAGRRRKERFSETAAVLRAARREVSIPCEQAPSSRDRKASGCPSPRMSNDSVFTTGRAPPPAPAAARHPAPSPTAWTGTSANCFGSVLTMPRRSAPCSAIAPAAASRLRTLDQFLEQVEYNGRRLAKLNMPPAEVNEILGEFGAAARSALAARFAPAREQLHLATLLALNQAYYQVREAESQAFFGLLSRGTRSRDLDDLLRRFVRILTRTFRARVRAAAAAGRAACRQTGSPALHPARQPRRAADRLSRDARRACVLLVFPDPAGGTDPVGFRRALSLAAARAGAAARRRRALLRGHRTGAHGAAKSAVWRPKRAAPRRRSGGASAANCTMRPANRCCSCGCNWK